MSAHWWAGRTRQFTRYVTGRVTAADRTALTGWLTAPQLALFDEMHRADQRHGLDVVAALRRAGHYDADLLVAGLLHDCGKGRALRVWHRVGWSLAEHYGRAVRRAFVHVPGFAGAFETLAAHAEVSARLAQTAGCTPRTVELIRHQADPIDEELGHALRLADEAS